MLKRKLKKPVLLLKNIIQNASNNMLTVVVILKWIEYFIFVVILYFNFYFIILVIILIIITMSILHDNEECSLFPGYCDFPVILNTFLSDCSAYLVAAQSSDPKDRRSVPSVW